MCGDRESTTSNDRGTEQWEEGQGQGTMVRVQTAVNCRTSDTRPCTLTVFLRRLMFSPPCEETLTET